MYKSYTGVGSRKTPKEVLQLKVFLAQKLESQGAILRSGGADGADSAFEYGVENKKHKEIYYANQATPAAMAIAERFHPAWDKCSPFARKLHGRNAFQVLGSTLDKPSKFLLCWTPDGCTQHIGRSYSTGGTGTAISIAEAYGVKVYNLQRPDHFKIATDWLK